jgi:hypothetical protein
MLRLRYVFLFVLLAALGGTAIGFHLGYETARVSLAVESVTTWTERMSVPLSLVPPRPISLDVIIPLSSDVFSVDTAIPLPSGGSGADRGDGQAR